MSRPTFNSDFLRDDVVFPADALGNLAHVTRFLALADDGSGQTENYFMGRYLVLSALEAALRELAACGMQWRGAEHE